VRQFLHRQGGLPQVKMRHRVGKPDAASQEGLSARGGQKPSPIRSYAFTVSKTSAPLKLSGPDVPEYRESRQAPLLTCFLLPHMTFYRFENRGHREYRKD
jgi:hypothetical protein